MFDGSQHETEVNDKFSKHKQLFSSKDILDNGSPSSGRNTIDLLIKGTPIKLKNYIKLMHTLGFIHVKNRSLAEEEYLT